MSRIVRPLLSAFLLFGIILPAVAQRPQVDRIAAQPNLRVTTRLAGHLPAWASSARDAGSVPDNTSLRLTFVLTRSTERQAAFTQLLADQQNPSSPSYHHWLTPQQIGTLYGPTQHDLNTLTAWLASEGLVVGEIAPSRVFVTVNAPVSTVANALGTSFHYFNVATAVEPSARPRISAISNPAIPAAFAAIVSSISGLSDIPIEPMSQGHSMAQPAALQPQITLSATEHYVTPGDFAAIFDINPTYNAGINGAGQKVAIIGRSRIAATDISQFESLTGLPANVPNVIIPPAGTDPGIASGSSIADQLEANLDVIRVIGTASQVQADLVISANNSTMSGISIAAQYEVQTLLDPVMNISFGACEANAGLAAVNNWDTLFSQAAAEGISVFISSGDSGAAACDTAFVAPPAPSTTQTRSINYICASTYATCVGGTEFNDIANPAAYWSSTNSTTRVSALGYIPEGGWNEPITVSSTGSTSYIVAASGGGASIYIPKPSWQTGTGVPSDGKRDVPDMSFPAAAHDGYYACFAAGGGDCSTGHFEFFAGTSAAAPAMAAITALLNQKAGTSQGNLNPLLYRLAATTGSPFHDATPATSGVASCDINTPSMCNNSTPSPTALTGGLAGYALTTGYDQVTGLGSLDVGTFLSAAASVTSIGVSTASSSLTLTAGAASGNTDAITVTSSFYDGNAALGCTVSYNGNGTPAFLPACSFNPGTVALLSNGSAVSTLTLSTTAPQPQAIAAVATVTHSASPLPTRSGNRTPASFALCSILLFTLLPARRRLHSFRSWQTLPTALILLVTLGALSACSGSSTPANPNPLLVSSSGTTLTVSATSLIPGSTAIFTATVANSGFNTTVVPTGTVQFFESGIATPIGTAPLTAGKATSSAIAFPTVGTYTITAVYQGDNNFSTSTSAGVPLVVTNSGTTVGSYTVTINATGANGLTASTAVALTVQ